jgi:hypothetical protein
MISQTEFAKRLKIVGAEYKEAIKEITDFTNFHQWNDQAKVIWSALAAKHALHA